MADAGVGRRPAPAPASLLRVVREGVRCCLGPRGDDVDFAKRVIGAMRLDAATYEAIEADPGALRQAAIVVAGFGIAAGIGLSGDEPTIGSVLAVTARVLAGWLSWALVVYHLGVRLLPERQTRADAAEIARTIGFSAAPGLFLAALVLPAGRLPAFSLISLWLLASMVVAVRQALDYTNLSRAIAVCAAGWAVAALLVLAIGFAFGPLVS
jgi:hypothetical protein